jgi:hypothetical protein
VEVGVGALVDDQLELAESLLVLGGENVEQPLDLRLERAVCDDAVPEPELDRALRSAPIRLISLVGRRPIRRVIRVVPPQPGVMPESTSGMPQTARSVAITKSQAIVISRPPPTA